MIRLLGIHRLSCHASQNREPRPDLFDKCPACSDELSIWIDEIDGVKQPAELPNREIAREKATILPTPLSGAGYADLGGANLRNFPESFGEQDFSGKTSDYVAERVGFEPTVRIAAQRLSSSKISHAGPWRPVANRAL